jgi:DnaJ family protein C protein 2
MSVGVSAAGGAEAAAGLSGFPFVRRIEPIGLGFLQLRRRAAKAGCADGGVGQGDAVLLEDEEAAGIAAASSLAAAFGAAAVSIVITIPDVQTDAQREAYLDKTYYEALGIAGAVGFMADLKTIKKAYHKMLLRYHPDKTGRGETDPVFLRIQDAFATLSDEDKRRSYDSQCDFNDKVPKGTEDTETDEKFLKVYRPVFERNARFSRRRPVPDLGGPTTALPVLHSFYKWWHNFDSWRDFSHEAKHDLDSAGGRDHKRYMAMENQREVRGLKKAEVTRVADFVAMAERLDPRLVRERERVAAEKAAKAQARAEVYAAEAKARADAEAAAVAAERAAEKAAKDEAAAAKVKRGEAKKAFRQHKHALRARCVAALGRQSAADVAAMGGRTAVEWMDDVSWMCERMGGIEDSRALEAALVGGGPGGDAVGGGGDDDPAAVACLAPAAVQALVAAVAAARAKCAEEGAAAEAKAAAARAREQARETARRAERARRAPWSDEEMALLNKFINKFPSGTGKRWETIAETLSVQLKLGVARTKEECLAMSHKINAARLEGRSLAVGQGWKKSGSEVSCEKQDSTKAPAPAKAAVKAAAATAKAGAAGGAKKAPAPVLAPGQWSVEQQRQLEAALRKYPASMGTAKERWTAISREVEGRSLKECVARFKELSAKAKASKK